MLAEIAPQPGDYDVPKHRWSAFHGTHLELSLRSRDIDTILLVGGSVHVGIASTAYDARDMDFQITIVPECCHGFAEQRAFFMEKVFPADVQCAFARRGDRGADAGTVAAVTRGSGWTCGVTRLTMSNGKTIVQESQLKENSMGKKGRVFVRGLTSETYGLGEFRRQQLEVERVRDDAFVVDDAKVAHSGDSEQSRTWWRIGPGDEDFLTQTIQVHFVELPPQSSNHGHGHQNEAAFYILEGRGYEIHDDQRYDWSKDDLVYVHTDSVHRHFNPYDEKALALVVKAKCTWMFMGLIQQGRSGPVENEERSARAKTGRRSGRPACWTARR